MLSVGLQRFGDTSRVAYGAVVYVINVCRHDVRVIVCGLGNAVSRL